MTFTPYGTVLQSNPHEGNLDESDSSGHGIWQTVRQDDKFVVVGKFVEYKANRQSGGYIGRGVIEFRLSITGDRFTGTAQTFRYDASGALVAGPLSSPFRGTRLTLDNANQQNEEL